MAVPMALAAMIGPVPARAQDGLFPDVWTYHCERAVQLSAVYFDDEAGPGVVLVAEGRVLVLPQAVSASGARYAAGEDVSGYEWWIKGAAARLSWIDVADAATTAIYAECVTAGTN